VVARPFRLHDGWIRLLLEAPSLCVSQYLLNKRGLPLGDTAPPPHSRLRLELIINIIAVSFSGLGALLTIGAIMLVSQRTI